MKIARLQNKIKTAILSLRNAVVVSKKSRFHIPNMEINLLFDMVNLCKNQNSIIKLNGYEPMTSTLPENSYKYSTRPKSFGTSIAGCGNESLPEFYDSRSS